MFTSTSPKQGDTSWVLLAKIVQAYGGTPRPGDTFVDLLRKWANLV